MKLPNREEVHISAQKLIEYLLSETHPVGKSKARFFRDIGFDETKASLLERSLTAIAQQENVRESSSSLYGAKYVIEGMLETPSGNFVAVRTVWIIEKNKDIPRFVTAYPVGH